MLKEYGCSFKDYRGTGVGKHCDRVRCGVKGWHVYFKVYHWIICVLLGIFKGFEMSFKVCLASINVV